MTISTGNIPPTVEITYPNEGAIVYGTITINGTAHDFDGDNTLSWVNIKIDNDVWQFATDIVSWSYSWDTTEIDDGQHIIFARSCDGELYSLLDSVNVTVDNDGNELLADADGPYSGFVDEAIQFIGSASGGTSPYNWHWDFGDGNTSTLQSPTHIYAQTGAYLAVLTVTDSQENTADDAATVTITEEQQDTTPPVIEVTKPKKALYLNNNRIMPFFTTIVIGDIDINVDVSDNDSGVNRVEFYIGSELKSTDSSSPYNWTWNENTFGRFTVKVKVYDNAGNNANYEAVVWKLF